MNKLALAITTSALLLAGCSTTHNVKHSSHHGEHHDHSVKHSSHHGDHLQSRPENYGWLPPTHSYKPMYTNKLLSDYTAQFAMKLIENMRYVSDRTPIAVTSFVDLDNNLKTTNILGNQLAESFINEMQEFGLSVVDFKHTGMIEINDNGDFAFSRQASKLTNTINIEYILSGTLSYTDRGVIVNARIIGTESKVVVASAKGFIPHFIIDSLQYGYRRDGINLSVVK